MGEQVFGVSDAIEIINQTLEYAYPTITITGEVANFKINQGKWVFFDIKDDDGSLPCFTLLFNLRVQIEDGMKVIVQARPKLTQWGKFSLTIEKIKPAGEGSIKKAFELLLAKLDKEGLFSPEKKRSLPDLPTKIGVISSTDAAGYKDFIKIINARFGGLNIKVYHTQVQGADASDQIISGIEYFNENSTPPEVIAILRGGGSRDDLLVFDDEKLIRKIAASRVPIITGIGHEVDTTLADLAADVRASTPSNAAEILVPDKREIITKINEQKKSLILNFINQIGVTMRENEVKLAKIHGKLEQIYESVKVRFNNLHILLENLNPNLILKRGYAVIRDENGKITSGVLKIGEAVEIENKTGKYNAKVIKKEVK